MSYATYWGPLFDLEEGRRRRDEGIAQVSDHNEPWIVLCQREAERYVAGTEGTFTGEDIRFHCSATVGCPKHPNAFGALINSLIRRGIIIPTGDYRQPKDARSHARKILVYVRK